MRACFCGLLLAPLLAAGAATPSSPASAPGELPRFELPKLVSELPKPTQELEASAFLKQNPVANVATALPDETRTSAQLEALLTTYVGTWRGESTWYSLLTRQIIRLPTEVVYRPGKKDGRNVLDCAITYQRNGTSTTTLSRLWVENGRIFSETTQGGKTQKYVAQSRGPALAWRTFGSMQTLLEFTEIETLHLTPDGGTLSSHGYEVQHGANGASGIVLETTELKLVR